MDKELKKLINKQIDVLSKNKDELVYKYDLHKKPIPKPPEFTSFEELLDNESDLDLCYAGFLNAIAQKELEKNIKLLDKLQESIIKFYAVREYGKNNAG